MSDDPVQTSLPADEGAPLLRTELDAYSGPLDLLLYLIRRDEVDIFDIPVARITAEYLKVVQALEILDLNVAGEFLVTAASLMEIKSRMLLPAPPEAEEEGPEGEEDDPRNQLVEQLLQYKRFKEASQKLREQLTLHSQRMGRAGEHVEVEAPPPTVEDLFDGVTIGDLMAAFVALMAMPERPRVQQIVLKDIPVAAYMEEIVARLSSSGGEASLVDCIGPVSSMSPEEKRRRVVGVFLALLELARRRRIRAIQAGEGFPMIFVSLRPPEDEIAVPPDAPPSPAPEPQPPAEEPALEDGVEDAARPDAPDEAPSEGASDESDPTGNQ